MKFDYSAVKDDVKKIESQLNKMNKALDNLRTGLEFMTSANNWNSPSKEYILKESKKLFSSMENVQLVSRNVNSYLDGILTNYKQMDEGLEQMFSSFFGGNK